jgi:hypothetical protein
VEADLHHAKYTPYLFALGFQHVIQFAAAQYYSLLIAMNNVVIAETGQH